MLNGPKLTLAILTKRAQRLTTRIPRGLLPILLSISVFIFSFFNFFSPILFVGSVHGIRLTYVSFRAHVKIAPRIVSYRDPHVMLHSADCARLAKYGFLLVFRSVLTSGLDATVVQL